MVSMISLSCAHKQYHDPARLGNMIVHTGKIMRICHHKKKGRLQAGGSLGHTFERRVPKTIEPAMNRKMQKTCSGQGLGMTASVLGFFAKGMV